MSKRGVNKVVLLGNVGQEPTFKAFDNGGCICNLTIATTESWKDKSTGEPKEHTEWHNVVFRNRLAEIVNEYVGKGAKLYVEGKLQTRKWQDKNGQDKYTTEVVALDMQMLDGRKEAQPQQQKRFQPQDQGPPF